MKRITLYLIMVALVGMTMSAQTARKQVIGNFDRSASNHYAYPYGTELKVPELSAAPAGYEPFYIDHYGRHGSRWLTNGKTYERPIKELTKAKEAGMLNLQGELLLRQLSIVYETSSQRVGDLSDEGALAAPDNCPAHVREFPRGVCRRCPC